MTTAPTSPARAAASSTRRVPLRVAPPVLPKATLSAGKVRASKHNRHAPSPLTTALRGLVDAALALFSRLQRMQRRAFQKAPPLVEQEQAAQWLRERRQRAVQKAESIHADSVTSTGV